VKDIFADIGEDWRELVEHARRAAALLTHGAAQARMAHDVRCVLIG
jgi:hypothetical protein